MKKSILLFSAALMLTGIASSQSLEVLEDAAELTLGDITMPLSAAGTIIFKECNSCEPRAMPVDSRTVYIGLRGEVSFDEFLGDVLELRASEGGNSTFVSLFYNRNPGWVTRIHLIQD